MVCRLNDRIYNCSAAGIRLMCGRPQSHAEVVLESDFDWLKIDMKQQQQRGGKGGNFVKHPKIGPS